MHEPWATARRMANEIMGPYQHCDGKHSIYGEPCEACHWDSVERNRVAVIIKNLYDEWEKEVEMRLRRFQKELDLYKAEYARQTYPVTVMLMNLEPELSLMPDIGDSFVERIPALQKAVNALIDKNKAKNSHTG